ADRNRSHWSTSKTPSYTKSVSWQHHPNVNPTLTLFEAKRAFDGIVFHDGVLNWLSNHYWF
ncbi:hypothetical protein ABN112_02480, partial [Escherichia coli]|uniref:hypothetical protein n=1 Tax=Escherichia coli TaxID=562 RepID=UPI0032D9BFE9